MIFFFRFLRGRNTRFLPNIDDLNSEAVMRAGRSVAVPVTPQHSSRAHTHTHAWGGSVMVIHITAQLSVTYVYVCPCVFLTRNRICCFQGLCLLCHPGRPTPCRRSEKGKLVEQDTNLASGERPRPRHCAPDDKIGSSQRSRTI